MAGGGRVSPPRHARQPMNLQQALRFDYLSCPCNATWLYNMECTCVLLPVSSAVMFVAGLDFAQQLAKRLSLGKGVVAANKGQQGMDDKVRETLRRLEEEGLEALSEESWKYVTAFRGGVFCL